MGEGLKSTGLALKLAGVCNDGAMDEEGNGIYKEGLFRNWMGFTMAAPWKRKTRVEVGSKIQPDWGVMRLIR